MEMTVASRPITYEADFETSAAIARMLRIRRSRNAHDIGTIAQVLEGRARMHADRWSPSAWVGGIAARAARAIAKELRIRRDTRALMAMSDSALKDIGLMRAQIGGAARYGRY